VIISTANSDEAANGGLRFVKEDEFGWRFYVVHEQGNLGDEGSGSGIFFRDLTIYQPAIYQEKYLGGSTDDGGTQPTPNPSVAAKRENTFLSVSQVDGSAGGRAYLSSDFNVSPGSTPQVPIDTAEFASGITFDASQNAFVVDSDGIYRISASLSYIDTVNDALVQCRVHVPGGEANGYYTTAKNVPVGIAGASIDTVEQLAQGDTIEMFTQYKQS
jgi:hypothetical protein